MLRVDQGNEDVINNLLGISLEGNQYLTFSIDDEEYGLPILEVKEMMGLKEFTKVPNQPEYVNGVINLRGEIIYVIDLRKRFGKTFKPYNKFTVLIIVEKDEKYLGLVVDHVKDVLNIGPENIKNAEGFESMVEEKYIKGIGEAPDRLVIILDVQKFIDRL